MLQTGNQHFSYKTSSASEDIKINSDNNESSSDKDKNPMTYILSLKYRCLSRNFYSKELKQKVTHYKSQELTMCKPERFLKSSRLRVTRVKLFAAAVAAIIASGNFVILYFLISIALITVCSSRL